MVEIGMPKHLIQNLPTDIAFTDSPDAGSLNCLCSRCSKRIDEAPIRIWTDHYTKEYRYHTECAFGTSVYTNSEGGLGVPNDSNQAGV